MSKTDVTEDDLRDALLAELRAILPAELGPDEFTISQWMEWNGITVRSLAESQLQSLTHAGVIERVPEQRLHSGHRVIAYRKTKPQA